MAKELDRFDPNLKKSISLKTKLIAMIVGASILGVAVTGAMSLKVFDNGLLKNAEAEISNTATGINYILYDWLDNLYRYGNMLSMEPSTREFFLAEDKDLPGMIAGLANMGPQMGAGGPPSSAGGPPAGASTGAGGPPSGGAAAAAAQHRFGRGRCEELRPCRYRHHHEPI